MAGKSSSEGLTPSCTLGRLYGLLWSRNFTGRSLSRSKCCTTARSGSWKRGEAFSDAFSAALSRFSIGPSATGWCSQGCHGIVDTGTFLLTIPGQFMSDFLQELGAEENNDGVGGKDALHPAHEGLMPWDEDTSGW